MGALLTSIMRALLTGIVLMIELTGKYDYMRPSSATPKSDDRETPPGAPATPATQ
jgi:hypothetical protein